MTAIFACICGNYDESQDLGNDFKDKHGPLNKHVTCLQLKHQSLFAYFFLNIFILFKE